MVALAHRTASLTLLFVALGCGSGSESDAGSDRMTSTPCRLGFLGSPDLPVDMKIVALGADRVSSELADGSDVAMILPPQGGRVIFVGARATNINACRVELSGALRDPTTMQVRVDARTTNLRPTGDGWGGPVDGDISSFSNIPVCPNQWASTAVYDHPFELTITLTDPDGRTATRMLSVVPRCSEAMFADQCLCQCQEDYMLGDMCP